MHHGTLLFSSSLPSISSALKVYPSKFEGKGIQSVRSRVTNISEHLKTPLTLAEFKRLITSHIQNSHKEFEVYDLSNQDIASVSRLEKEKYATWNWNYGASPAYNHTTRKKFPAGSVEIFINVTGGKIGDIRLFGDFFGEYELSEIENVLKGLPYEKAAVKQLLYGFDLSLYFSSIGTDDFINVMF